jgi:hypothetical protein
MQREPSACKNICCSNQLPDPEAAHKQRDASNHHPWRERKATKPDSSSRHPEKQAAPQIF